MRRTTGGLKALAALTAVGTLLALAGCTSGDAGGTGSGVITDGDSKPLRVAYYSDASSLDPIAGTAGTDHVLLYPVYDTLVSFDPETLTPEPGLAESWEQTDDALVLNLREDVTFHDGTVFDADAVVFNITRAKGESSLIGADLARVESATAVDDHTVRLDLNRADTSLLLTLADRAGMMVSPTAADEMGEDLGRHPVGAGPWELEEWQQGSKLTYAAYKDYWDADAVRAPKLEFSVMSNATTRLSALRSGQQDMSVPVLASQVETLEKTEGLALLSSPSLYIATIYFDASSKPFDDKRVRIAFNLALDREQLLKTSYAGMGTAASTVLPPQHWAAPEAGSLEYKHDAKAAKELLAEAGYSDGVKFTMIVFTDPERIRTAEIMKQQLAEAGFEMEILPREITQGTTEFFSDRAQPALFAGWTGRPDPGQAYRSVMSKDGYNNAGHIEYPGMEAAIEEANTATDIESRAAAFREAAQLAFDEGAFGPMVFVDQLTGISDNVEGFVPNLLGKPKFVGVTVN